MAGISQYRQIISNFDFMVLSYSCNIISFIFCWKSTSMWK